MLVADVVAEDSGERAVGAGMHRLAQRHARPGEESRSRSLWRRRTASAPSCTSVSFIEKKMTLGELFVPAKSCIIASSGVTFIIAAISSTKCFSYCANVGFPIRVM